MSQLQTYDVEELSVIGREHPEDLPVCPGDVVCHVEHRDTTNGMVVAIDDHHATVLWSKEPRIDTMMSGGFMWAPYVPLQVTPTLFASSGSQMPATSVTGSFVSYAKKAINAGYYGVVNVLNLVSGSK